LDVESDPSGLLTARGRAVRRSPLLRRVALGTGLVVAVALGAAALKGRPGGDAAGTDTVQSDVRTVQAFSKKPVKKFQQCGGADFEGSTCCETGCACIIKTQYYSMCTTPSRISTCSVSAAAREAKLAEIRAETAKSKIKPAAKRAAAAKKKADAATAEFDKVRKPLAALRSKGDKARKAWMAAKKAYDDMKAEYDKESQFADDQDKAYKWTKSTLDVYKKTKALNDKGTCANINGQCGGQIAPDKACCIIGCRCHWKNSYYGQCAPSVGTSCPEGVKPFWDMMGELQANTSRLEKIMPDAIAKKEKAEKALPALEKRYNETHKVAIKAGTARSVAEKHARAKKAIADKATKEYDDLQKAADHAVHNIRYTKATVGVWKKVASGDSCSSLKAADVVKADSDELGGGEAEADASKEDGGGEESV